MLLPVFLLLFTVVGRPAYDPPIQESLREIDRCLLMQEEIILRKEARIDSLQALGVAAKTLQEQYEVYDKLFEEYLKWDSDSAFYYGNRKKALAEEAANPVLVNDAAIDLAKRHLISGMYHDALDALLNIDYDAAALSGQLSQAYYVHYNIYRSLVHSTRDDVLQQKYKAMEDQYLKACLATLTPQMWEYHNVYSYLLVDNQQYQEARDMLLNRLDDGNLSLEDLSNLNFSLGRIYDEWGQEDQALYYYAQSAINDLIQPVRQGLSLMRVAQYCFEMGDIQRAYNYIIRSHNDALKCDAVIRLHQMAGLIPTIIQAHERQERHRRIQLILLVGTLSLLLGLLFFARLRLRRSNRRLKTANQLKDAYLGEFLSMFAEQMNSLERYRVNLRVAARSNSFDELLEEIRSDTFVESEWNLLMEKFDKTFLGLYPHFVEQLNELLLPDKQIGLDLPAGVLNNQLRCYALIRLGITKSGRIAKFLRLSSSTVYNFRNALRASARGSRSDIEQQLATLGE